MEVRYSPNPKAAKRLTTIWGMGGENQAFANMDFVEMSRLR